MDDDGDEELERDFELWIQSEVDAGKGTREEIEDALVANPRLIPRRFVKSALTVCWVDEVDEQVVSGLRSGSEEAFRLLQRLSKEKQVARLAAILERARDIDCGTAQLRGAITQLEKQMPRLEVWRVLQALADNYRAGDPLCMVDRCVLLADEHLDRGVMAAASDANGSRAFNVRKAIKEKVSKTISKARKARASALPADQCQVDVRDRFPLAMDLMRVMAEALGVKLEVRRKDGSTVEPETVAAAEQPLQGQSNSRPS